MAKGRKGKQDDDSPEQQPEGIDEPSVDGPPEVDMGMTQLVTVVQAHNMKEARTMKSILESAEIPAFLGSEESAESGTDAVAFRGIPILVPEEMSGQAAEILADAAMDDDSLLDDEADEEFEDEWDDRDERKDYFDDVFEEMVDEDDDHYDDLDPLEDDEDY